MKPLLLLLLPFSVLAQDVEPVISKDYLELIRDSSQHKSFRVDTTNNVKNSVIKLYSIYNGYAVGKIKIKNGYLKIEPVRYKYLTISGNLNSTIEIKRINQLPGLQNQYVQGRSQNGTLVWQGPETGEQFSYGPGINALEFDGSNYAYDVNGKLVAAGSGNGQKAINYKNNIFRTASLLSQSLMTQAKYVAGGNKQYSLKIKAGQGRENTFISGNRNSSHDFSILPEAVVMWLKVSAGFSDIEKRFSNSNRNGFLNHVYQNSILTPASFDNRQGSTIGNFQRSYSNAADNPFFLLEDNDNSFSQSHRMGNFSFEVKPNRIKLRIAQSMERLEQRSSEGYKPGTALFPNGITVNRKKSDANYFFNPSVTVDINYNDNYDYFSSTLSTNYIYSDSHSTINYDNKSYNYQRFSHDLSLIYKTLYNGRNFEAGLNLENKAYASNTSSAKDFFLPGISGFARLNNLLNYGHLSLKLVSSFINFNSELPINTSFSQNSLVQYTADQALQFLPVTEISSFNNLPPTRHKEWMARLEVSYKNQLTLRAEVFNRNTKDDIFPVYESGLFNLKNIASHRNRGIELELGYNYYRRNFSTNNILSFFANRDIVTEVREGYNFTPIAGFSNVNKAIVKGEILGTILGNRYLRDGKNNVIIGSDGFPLADAVPGVIGNPAPDFIMKLSNNIGWKRFNLNIDWEWKKGGDVWNGTQAVLDYYGRSQNSAVLRRITNYVFEGTLQDGRKNNIPVSFYDPALSLEKNRWTRYGYTGVAEEYIQSGDQLKINNIGLSYKLNFRKHVQTLAFTLYAGNIIVWAAYKGTDSDQMLYDQPNTNGFDFFNLPSLKTFGFNVSIQF